jgi:ribosomal-protein-alanine N-acetyltransferase
MGRSAEKPREDAQPRGFSASETALHLRRMKPSDLQEVMAIEKASFSYPWSYRFFLQELKVPCARSLLAVSNGKTLGYIIYWFLPSEVDIHNLAVSPVCRRRGIGRSLLQAVIDEARQNRCSRVTLEVRVSNQTAQKLYQSLGFVAQGIRKGYYSDNGEDAVAMVLEFKKSDVGDLTI